MRGRAPACLGAPGMVGLFRRLLERFDAEDKVEDVEQPDRPEDDPPHGDLMHHDEADRHQQRDGYHDADLRLFCHSLALEKALEIVFIQLRAGEPLMQPFRTARKGVGREQQKRKCRKQRQHRADGAERQADAAENDKQNFFNLHAVPPVVSFPSWFL